MDNYETKFYKLNRLNVQETIGVQNTYNMFATICPEHARDALGNVIEVLMTQCIRWVKLINEAIDADEFPKTEHWQQFESVINSLDKFEKVANHAPSREFLDSEELVNTLQKFFDHAVEQVRNDTLNKLTTINGSGEERTKGQLQEFFNYFTDHNVKQFPNVEEMANSDMFRKLETLFETK